MGRSVEVGIVKDLFQFHAYRWYNILDHLLAKLCDHLFNEASPSPKTRKLSVGFMVVTRTHGAGRNVVGLRVGGIRLVDYGCVRRASADAVSRSRCGRR